MNCPRCRRVVLKEQLVKGTDVVVDRCSRCKGIWFDRGELDKVTGAEPAEVLIPRNAVRLLSKCPRCDKPLYVFHYPATWIAVEMCKGCTGFWLDAGEFGPIRKARESLAQQGISVDQTAPGGVKGTLIQFIDQAIEALRS